MMVKKSNHSDIINKILVWKPIAAYIIFNNKHQFISTLNQNQPINYNLQSIPDILERIAEDIIGPLDFTPSINKLISSYFGWYGYLNYDCNVLLEQFKHKTTNAILPDVILTIPSIYLIENSDGWLYIELLAEKVLIPNIKLSIPKLNKKDVILSNFSYNQYISKVEKIIDYIQSGEIYQANLTQQFVIHNANQDYRDLFINFSELNPVPYAAYLEFQNFSIISLSPELFIQISDGRVITKPIKGTRPRGKTTEEDRRLAQELKNSEKDNAELSMIVDLLRNDLGKSSDPGSVVVNKHAALESYSNVHHLVSTITSTIPRGLKESWRLFLRAFPGGSITGCPKIRAMEIIDELETVSRGVYTGSIGFLACNGDLEFNIAIRTAVASENILIFNAGGGIVADSIAIDEYIETLHKAKHFLSLFDKSFVGRIIFYNGKYYSSDRFKLPAKHLNSIDGFFETMLVRDSKIINYKHHLQRINKALRYYDISLTTSTFEDINLLIRLNIAENARIKLMVSITSRSQINCSMTIAPYTPSNAPIRLILGSTSIKPNPILMGGMKPLDYEVYRQATRIAVEKGYWDQLLFDNNNKLLETGRANIYLFQDKWYTPRENVVQGVIRDILISTNVVSTKNLYLSDIYDLNKTSIIMISNALNGLRLVEKIVDDSQNIIWKYNKNKKNEVIVNNILSKLSVLSVLYNDQK